MAHEEHLLKFLQKLATEQQFDKFDVRITAVSSGGANYTSKLYQVKISGDGRPDLHLFAKVAIMGEKIRSQALMDPYDNERFVYTQLLQTYRQLEEKYGISERDRLKFPKYYGIDMTHMQEILVLEDLASRGFGSANRFQSVDWSYAAAAITELAKLHALSMAYQHYHPGEFEEVFTRFPSGMFPDSGEFDLLFNHSITTALAAVREENKEKLNAYFKAKSISKMYNGMLKALRRKVLLHVDFRPNNMLHKVMNDGTTEVIPVDYQTIQGGCPIVDLMYFIFTATDGMFREKYYQKLVDHYHSELGEVLSRLGLRVEDEYSKENFEYEMEEKRSFGLLVAVMLLPILTVPEDQAPSLDDLELSSLAIEVTSDLYAQRLNEVVDEYVAWGVL